MFDKDNNDIFDKISENLLEIQRQAHKDCNDIWYSKLSDDKKAERSVYPFGLPFKPWRK